MSDEYGWVIERDLHSKLHYWAGRNGDDWRPDHFEALRLARRADAELMLTYHCGGVGRVVEHAWHDQPGGVTVFINGETHVIPNGGVASYEQLVALAGLTGNPSMTISFGDRKRAGRAPYRGHTIQLDAGAHVTVVHTGNA